MERMRSMRRLTSIAVLCGACEGPLPRLPAGGQLQQVGHTQVVVLEPVVAVGDTHTHWVWVWWVVIWWVTGVGLEGCV